jgi:hypothetical protein
MPLSNEAAAVLMASAVAVFLWQQRKFRQLLEQQTEALRERLEQQGEALRKRSGDSTSLPTWVTDSAEFKRLLPHPLPPKPTVTNPSTFKDPFAGCRLPHSLSRAFTSKLHELFPGAMNHEEAAVAVKHVLRKRGFTAKESIALVAQCRDEITKPFTSAIDTTWLGSFNIGALAGSVICGTTGFNAALHHAPQDERQVERYVIFCGPHIAIDEHGVVGNVARRGRVGVSTACGALVAFAAELSAGQLSLDDKPLDVEYSYLKRRLLPHLHFGREAPDLAKLTRIALDATVNDVRAILKAVGKESSVHAIASGVLIHGPNDSHFFWPSALDVHTGADAARPREDLVAELRGLSRTDYHAEMLWYLTAKSQAANLLCMNCSEPVATS